MKVDKKLQAAYDDQYNTETQGWRDIGAIYKADNISSLIKNNKFNNILECGAGDGANGVSQNLITPIAPKVVSFLA